MGKRYKVLIFLQIVVFLACSYGCQKRTDPWMYEPGPAKPAEWKYEKDAVHLKLKADPQLNLYQGKAYTLVICVYQLTSPNIFQGFTEDQTGLSKLLECNRFDASVASYKKLVIQPGQELNTSLDRAEGAKYIGLVAGYYQLRKENIIRLLPIPIIEEIKYLPNQRPEKFLKPGPMNIELSLGPLSIQANGGL